MLNVAGNIPRIVWLLLGRCGNLPTLVGCMKMGVRDQWV